MNCIYYLGYQLTYPLNTLIFRNYNQYKLPSFLNYYIPNDQEKTFNISRLLGPPGFNIHNYSVAPEKFYKQDMQIKNNHTLKNVYFR